MFQTLSFVPTRACPLLLALLLSAPASASGAPRSSATRAANAHATPSVRGVVVDSVGQPIADVQVIVNALNRVTRTNDSGRFVFAGLPAGAFHLTALQLGFRPGHADIIIPVDGADISVRIVMARGTSVTQLASVQVTATPIGTDPRDVAQSTTEVSAAQLSRTLSGTVAQTLANEPGISVRYNGPAASAPVIRGLSGERVLVLQDGERAGDLSATSPDHSVSIDPLTAQRIEIVRGPASLLYGNNALGGVVNVISNDLPTSIPQHVDGYLNASTESGTPGGAVAGGITVPVTSALALVARGGARRGNDLRTGEGGTLPNSYFNNFSGVGGLGYVGSKGTAGLLYRGYTFDYGPHILFTADPWAESLIRDLLGENELGFGFLYLNESSELEGVILVILDLNFYPCDSFDGGRVNVAFHVTLLRLHRD